MTRAFLLCLLLCAGCARIVPLRSGDEIDAMNRRGAEQFAVVTLDNGLRLSAQRLQLRSDTLWVREVPQLPDRGFPMGEIRSIRFANNLEGARRGARIGGPVLLGAAAVYVVGNGWLSYPPSAPFGPFVLAIALITPAIGASVGTVVGGATGFLLGAPCRYVPVADTTATGDSLVTMPR
jgi:hypothetical protein